MWNPFRRGGKQPPAGAAPTPPAAPSPGTQPPKPRGLGRLFRRRPKAPPPTPPTAPSAEAPTPAPPGEAGPPPERGEKPAREYPSSLSVSGEGTWKISKTLWHGTASGVLTGAAVKVFLDAMEAGDVATATLLIAQAYDDGSGFSDMLDLSGTTIEISYG